MKTGIKLAPLESLPFRYHSIIHRQSGYNVDEYEHGYVLFDKHKKVLGYVLLTCKKSKATIDWIYAKPTYGSILLAKTEQALRKKNIETIELLCSIDELENQSKVLRRINFYIKNLYRVKSIRYRKIGPIFTMIKKLI